MKHKKLKLIAALLSGLALTTLQAQEVKPASGGDASGNGGSVSYSVGQVTYTTNTGTNGSVSQGVQQPYEISTVTGIEEAKGINLSCSAYPNPATDYLMLKIENYTIDKLFFQLYSTNGKLIENTKLTGSETKIDMSNLNTAVYFLKIIQNNKEVKIFKIIKK